MSQVNKRYFVAMTRRMYVYKSSVFSLHLVALTSSVSLQLSDSNFQIVGALTQKAFADRANGN